MLPCPRPTMVGVVGYPCRDARGISDRPFGFGSESPLTQVAAKSPAVMDLSRQMQASQRGKGILSHRKKNLRIVRCCQNDKQKEGVDEMANYVIMRIEKRQMGFVTAIGNHHERLKEKYKSNPDIVAERTHLNYHIVEPNGKYRSLVEKRIQESGAKKRKNSVVLQDAFVSATPEWIRALPEEEQRSYLNHAYEFFKNRFGEENIISAVVHLDEATPHMHLVFVPITKDGRLSSKELIGGPKGLSKLQDDFYEHMAERYPELSRGIPKSVTHRKHLPSYLYKNARELDKKYDQLVAAVEDIGIMNNARKKDEAIALLGRYAPEMAKMEGQLKTTENYIRQLECQVHNDERALNRKDSTIQEKDLELFKERSKVRELEARQKKLVHLIDKIPRELLNQMEKDEKNRRKKEGR